MSGHNDVASVIISPLPMVLSNPQPAKTARFRAAGECFAMTDLRGYSVVTEPLVPRHRLAVQADETRCLLQAGAYVLSSRDTGHTLTVHVSPTRRHICGEQP